MVTSGQTIYFANRLKRISSKDKENRSENPLHPTHCDTEFYITAHEYLNTDD